MAYWRDQSHLSENAQKYGQAYAEGCTNRSGLTPTEFDLETGPKASKPLGIVDTSKYRENQQWQRNHTGFTLSQLVAGGATSIVPPASDLKENNLTNEICPVFARERWTVAPLPSDRFQAEFAIEKDDFWEVLLPILRLASHILTSNYTSDWWDGLVKGPREDITPDRLPREPKQPRLFRHERFLPRDPSLRLTDMADWTEFTSEITWRIGTGVDPKGWLGDTGIYNFNILRGAAAENQSLGPPFMKINTRYEELRPLLPSFEPRLSTADRLTQQFSIACVYLHELAHAVNAHIYYKKVFSVPTLSPDPNISIDDISYAREPYYQDEYTSELGYSMENSLFGGHVSPLIHGATRHDRKMTYSELTHHLSLGFAVNQAFSAILESYPKMRGLRVNLYQSDDVLANPYTNDDSLAMTGTEFPIPIKYYEEIQQEAFWTDYIGKFGGDKLKCWPKLKGKKTWRKMNGIDDEFEPIFGPEYLEWLEYIKARETALADPKIGKWDAELLAITSLPDTDPSKHHRLSRLQWTRQLAQNVQNEVTRMATVNKNYDMAGRIPSMKRTLDASIARRKEVLEAWNQEVERRQLADRQLAEAYPMYKPPQLLGFGEWLELCRDFEEGRRNDMPVVHDLGARNVVYY